MFIKQMISKGGVLVNFEYLELFHVVILHSSISKAAKQLHLSQPALSMQIQALEKELGTQLLIRSTKGVQLTPAGEILYNYTKSILSLKENIQRDIQNIQKRPQLLLGFCTTIGEYLLPSNLFLYKDRNPNIEIHVEICNTPGVIEKLLNHTVRLGIIKGIPQDFDQEIEITKFLRDKLVLVVQPDFWKKINKNDSDSITIKELLQYPLVIREKGSGTRRIVEEALKNIGMKLEDCNIVVEYNSPQAVKTSVLSGQGLCFAPTHIVEDEINRGKFKIIELRGIELLCQYYIAYLKDTKLNIHEKVFLDFLHQMDNNIDKVKKKLV
jgi:DNA-binding transcriptional LysR family regulator